MNKDLQRKLTSLENLIAVQKDCISGSGIDYMHGMANGMILSHAIFTDSTPKYVTRIRRHYGRIVRHKCCKSKGHR